MSANSQDIPIDDAYEAHETEASPRSNESRYPSQQSCWWLAKLSSLAPQSLCHSWTACERVQDKQFNHSS